MGTWVDVPPTTIGTLPNTNAGNTLPFGGTGVNSSAATYQQVYQAGLFGSGLLRMMAVEFFVVPSASRPNPQVTPAQYTFSLSSTTAQVDALNTTNLAANVGANNQVVVTGTLAGAIVNNVLSVPFTNPFVYSPTSGNLILQVLRSTPGQFTGVPFYSHSPGDGYQAGLSSRAQDYAGVGQAGFYLVTKFHHQRCVCPSAAPCSC
jgi:hypothetical protein